MDTRCKLNNLIEKSDSISVAGDGGGISRHSEVDRPMCELTNGELYPQLHLAMRLIISD